MRGSGARHGRTSSIRTLDSELHACRGAVDRADLVVVLVRHRQFASISFGDKPMIDTVGLTAQSPAPSPTPVG
jgi:hypothetical protein